MPNIRFIKKFFAVILLISAFISAGRAYALPLETYAEKSLLSEGKWVKISVTASGVHLITTADLRQMGFNDPSKVRIYGYGATQLPDILDTSYVDDLPMVQTLRTDRGILFYAVGPTNIKTVDNVLCPHNNPFSTKGYYFISESDAPEPQLPVEGLEASAAAPITVTGTTFYEKDLTNPGHTGYTMLGDDFRYTSSRTYKLEMPDRLNNGRLTLVTSFMAKSTENGYIRFNVNGNDLGQTSNDRINNTSDSHVHYIEAFSKKTLDNISPDASTLNIILSYSSTGNVTTAALNYICVNYDRVLRPVDTGLHFNYDRTAGTMEGGNADTQVWDITDPAAIVRMNTQIVNGNISWRNVYTGQRQYYTFSTAARLPSPKFEGQIANSNLHGMDVPDMIIFTLPEWNSQARRLADLHRDRDGMTVAVVNQGDVFNEFASGMPDVQAFRKMLKMLYDRGNANGKPLRYALFFGRGTYDNRRITPEIQQLDYPTMPLWQTVTGASDNSSYSTDDIFGMLDDGAGRTIGADKLRIGIGRMPVTSATDCRNAVDKIEAYLNSASGQWRNRVMLIADDQDFGTHLQQTERMFNAMLKWDGTDMTYKKLYTDAYTQSNGTYPEARTQMFRTMEEGVSLITYIGHANTTSWTHEGLLTYTDINNLHLKYFPIVYAATCEFQRVDNNAISAGEIMWKLTTGGCIAMISANRPVYIDQNGTLSESFGRNIFRYDSDGQRMRLGDIIMNAKNNYGNPANDGRTNTSNENKLRYSLIGDPALRPIIPAARVVVDLINGQPVDDDNPPVIKAFQNATMEGHIETADGTAVDNFNGILTTTIFDAEYSVTTKANGDNGTNEVFEQQGDRLYVGSDNIRDGKFSITIPMPTEISNNWRPAAAQFYASATSAGSSVDQAGGVSRDFYLFGYDETTPDDNTPPTIKSIYINHPTFKNGDLVNLTPMLIAELTDNRGINIATSGVGRQMVATIDNRTTYTDLAESFVPSTTDNGGGILHYQLPQLNEGNHTLTLRVWDTAGNVADAEVSFFARGEVRPTLYDIYAEMNTASAEANFYLSHDRPDATIDVALTIYNLLGQPVRTINSKAGSDLYLSNPIKWDLTDDAGRRVPRGIYIYRAHISESNLQSDTKSHKIAVTAH